MPNFEMGFKDHHHTNDWLTIYEGEEDKYEFQYSLLHSGILDNGGTPPTSQPVSSSSS
jgi:hypothetical protein